MPTQRRRHTTHRKTLSLRQGSAEAAERTEAIADLSPPPWFAHLHLLLGISPPLLPFSHPPLSLLLLQYNGTVGTQARAPMKRTTGTHLPPPLTKSQSASDDPEHPRRRPLRRRVRSPAFLSGKRVAAAAGGAGAAGRRSGPATPLLRWKFNDADVTRSPPEDELSEGRRKPPRTSVPAASVSARRLAAGIWQLQLPEAPGGARRVPGRGGVEPVIGHLRAPQHPCSRRADDKDSNDDSASSLLGTNSHNAVYMVEPSMAIPNHAMERATKWDPGFSKASEEACQFYGQMKFLEDQQVNAVTIVSNLRQELERARVHISELEDEGWSSKKKFEHILRKIADEKVAWRSREHEKIRAVIDGLKDDLSREKKNRQRLEIVNSKLLNELTEAKLSAKRCMQDYEKERKARELMEEVCDELAKEIGEDKAEVEALKKESLKLREEVEEERRMLQMAEVWREERVQMKLIDAKLTLEEKYVQLSKLRGNLENFLRNQSGNTPNSCESQEAEMLIEAVNSVRIHDIKEFSYQPPRASEDIFSVFEELQPTEDTHEREIEQCYGYSPTSHASKIHTVSPEVNGLTHNPVLMHANRTNDTNENIDDDSWETVSHGEENGSSNSPNGSDPSVNGAYQESNASMSGTDREETVENGKLSSEISEVCSGSTKVSRRKSSSISRLWGSSGPKNVEGYKVVAVDVTNGRLSNARISNGTASPERDCGEVGISSPSVGQWSSPDSMNPHITRGMKGCIEWPKGIQKQSLKSKLLEARTESQKFQLRHVLKQKS